MRFSKLVLIWLLISVLGISGCASNFGATQGSNKQKQPKLYVNPELAKWNTQQKVQLLPHQLVPIEYLERHPDIRGLLLYHYLGTGKTYTALGFIQRNPNMPVVILAPRFLRSHWQQHIQQFGITNTDRIQIITHEEPESLLKINLSNSIVIIDESHKIIERINYGITLNEGIYTSLYLHLNTAKRILSLTGTPIYGSLTDLAYQINLVSGKNEIPFNKAEFNSEFMQINPTASFFRGHMAESVFAPVATSSAALGLALATASSPAIVGLAAFGGYFIPGLFQTLYPIPTTPLRQFSPNALQKSVQKYVSYYDFNNPDKAFFPTSKVFVKDVLYTKPQLDFLFDFEDSRLDVADVQLLLKDYNKKLSNEVVALNSTNIQNSLNDRPGAGQQISNIPFAESGSSCNVAQPYKFRKILNIITSEPGPTVLYSHYYYNGILRFATYLDNNGKKGKYAILHPDMSSDEHAEVISRYNKGSLEILLIHPEITEGISLIGTRQMHLLETPYNRAFQEQIIGRVVRYKSHMHLPVSERNVKVYVWKTTMPTFGLNENLALRENWHNYFAEFNYYSNFGQGRIQVDPNAARKAISPDDMAYAQLETLDVNMNKLRAYLEVYSIENLYEKGTK